MLQPENMPKKYDFLFADIDTGRIKIPKFQRDFVWNKQQTASLIDSIIKGFPIGTFIFWKTTEELRHVKEIGNVNLPDPPPGEPVMYVLDGQQRITSLYAVRKGIRVDRDGKEIDYCDIAINLDLDPDDDYEAVTTEMGSDAVYIGVHELLNSDLTDLFDRFSREHIKKIDIYKKRLTTYDFSTIVITNYPIDIACEVFTRINTGGTELTLFEIMVAKTYDLEKNFDLAEQFDLLIDNNGTGKDLEDANFDTIPNNTVLQCVATNLIRGTKRKDILKLDKTAFIEAWPTVKDGIFTAVDYLRNYLNVSVSQLLPYNALLVSFTYFFNRTYGRQPNVLQNKLLEQYFWWASLSNRFSAAAENKLVQDLDRMDAILNNEIPSYRGEELNLTLDDIQWRWFSTGDSFCKAILCLYASFMPRSFTTDKPVRIDNSWLKSTSSKNYHHFFPKSYLKKKGYPYWQANCILNITIVDDYLNKRRIGSKSPGDYMLTFLDENPELESTMQTHLVYGLDAFGIWEDDFEKFIEARGKQVLEELGKRLNPVL
jgi:hypothetical protein